MRTVRLRLSAFLASLLVVVAYAALVPVASASRREVFEIPKGTWARRRAGDLVEILPNEIRLVLGVRDILVLRNLDDVPQMFGPTLIMPGQSFSLPFEVASDYQFACTAHLDGQMTVVVEEKPNSAWARVCFRADELMRAVRAFRKERFS